MGSSNSFDSLTLVVPVVALYALPTKELMTKRVIRLLAFAGMALYGCHASNQIVGDHPGTMATSPEPSLITETTWEVLTKRAPDTLIARDGSSCRDVLWKSTYVYAGTGPSLDPASLAGVAALGAGMGFDIYQVGEEP